MVEKKHDIYGIWFERRNKYLRFIHSLSKKCWFCCCAWHRMSITLFGDDRRWHSISVKIMCSIGGRTYLQRVNTGRCRKKSFVEGSLVVEVCVSFFFLNNWNLKLKKFYFFFKYWSNDLERNLLILYCTCTPWTQPPANCALRGRQLWVSFEDFLFARNLSIAWCKSRNDCNGCNGLHCFLVFEIFWIFLKPHSVN